METKICPRCGKEYTFHPAMSRKDNKTEICSNCGLAEALLQMAGKLDEDEWKIKPKENK